MGIREVVRGILLEMKMRRCVCVCDEVLQSGKSLQGVKGSRSNCGQLVVIQRKQTDIVKPCKAVVVDTTDFVVPQHPTEERHNTPY